MNSCATCKWFEANPPGLVRRAQELGECRMRKPETNGWPRVYSDDWCGEWLDKVKEP